MLFMMTHIVTVKVELNQLTEQVQSLMVFPIFQEGYDLHRFPLSLNHLTTQSMMGRHAYPLSLNHPIICLIY
jgi:hypothetical protein